jgi:4-hydroxy-tetrahydrodipicolinate reductase
MTRIVVTGATGRMGRTVIETANERGDEVVAAVHHGDGGESVCGLEIEPAADLDAILRDRDPDALIDFTGPKSTFTYVSACAAAGTPVVIGTTGFDDEGLDALREHGDEVPVLRAANFSRGVQTLRNALSEAVRGLPGYDVEITETHHNAKRDAPSGTALTLVEDVEAVREDAGKRVHGREGDAPRDPGEIGVHARRAGNVTGEHEVLLAGNHEEVRLTHRVEDRAVFAAGALDAAAWLVGRDPGWYDFSDVVAQRTA